MTDYVLSGTLNPTHSLIHPKKQVLGFFETPFYNRGLYLPNMVTFILTAVLFLYLCPWKPSVPEAYCFFRLHSSISMSMHP